MQKFEEYVTKIDETPLTGSQKMWIFDKVLMSKISWDFLIHDMTVSFVEDLAATQTRMFKKWVNYSRSGNPTVFYRSKKNFGWNMKEMVTFLKKQQLIKCNMLKCSEDSDVRQLYEARRQQEYDASISMNTMMRQFASNCRRKNMRPSSSTQETCEFKKGFWNRRWNSQKKVMTTFNFNEELF